MTSKTGRHGVVNRPHPWKWATLLLLACSLPVQGQSSRFKTWADVAKELAAHAGQPKAAATPPKAKGTYTTVDIPGASFLQLEGINSRGQIVGTYYDSNNNLQNFLLHNDVFRNIDPPGGGFEFLFLMTQAGINPQGDIVATYADSSGVSHGFLLSKGAYTYLNAPGATPLCAPAGTWPAGINPQGDIVGFYETIDVTHQACASHGFLFTGGAYTRIDVPATLGAAAGATAASAINWQGDIVGQYLDSSGNNHGFLLSDGTFKTIDVSGPQAQTFPLGISQQGDIVGFTFASGGFLISDGNVTSIDVPGSLPLSTIPYGINPEGDIVGAYLDANSKSHGFVLKRN
jgi:uncharacterized membrane protein